MYAHEPGLFPDSVQRVAMQFAEPAGLLLNGAIASRTVIGQATGIIMAQRGCGPDEALKVLTKISNDRNIKLREVARVLVEAYGPGGG